MSQVSQTTITRVHAPNSLEHLSQRPVRPRSSGSLRTPLPTPGRPQSASSYYRGTKTMSRPASAAARMPTANRIPEPKPASEMSKLQKAIYGQSGPPMSGVTTYPYSRAQKLYEEDFEQVVASSLTHPFMSITSFNVGSAPHNLITGTAFSERRSTAYQTECARAYTPKSYNHSFNLKANGLRLEEFMRVGASASFMKWPATSAGGRMLFYAPHRVNLGTLPDDNHWQAGFTCLGLSKLQQSHAKTAAAHKGSNDIRCAPFYGTCRLMCA